MRLISASTCLFSMDSTCILSKNFKDNGIALVAFENLINILNTSKLHYRETNCINDIVSWLLEDFFWMYLVLRINWNFLRCVKIKAS